MGVSNIEKCPQDLDARWSAAWRLARDEMKAVDTFSASMRPLLDEYVYALKAAEQAREGFAWLDSLEVYAENADDLPAISWTVLGQIAAGMPAMWDRHTKRAMELAGLLGLTPKAQKALAVKAKEGEDGDQDDPFGALDKDELAAKRKGRAQTA